MVEVIITKYIILCIAYLHLKKKKKNTLTETTTKRNSMVGYGKKKIGKTINYNTN